MADGATLAAGVGGGSLNASAVTFGSAGATTFGAILTNPAAVPLINASTLTAQGTLVNVAPVGANIATGTYKLLQYGGGSIAGNGFAGFALGPAGSYPHITANLVNNTVDGRIDLNVTAVDSLIWTGATNGAWDVNATQNFKLASDGTTPANFFTGDRVSSTTPAQTRRSPPRARRSSATSFFDLDRQRLHGRRQHRRQAA